LSQIQGDDVSGGVVNKAVKGEPFPLAEPIKRGRVGLQEFTEVTAPFPPGKPFSTALVGPFRQYTGGFENTAAGGITDAHGFPLLQQFPKMGEVRRFIGGALFQGDDFTSQLFIGVIGGETPHMRLLRDE
jgi:hypothetical protein